MMVLWMGWITCNIVVMTPLVNVCLDIHNADHNNDLVMDAPKQIIGLWDQSNEIIKYNIINNKYVKKNPFA